MPSHTLSHTLGHRPKQASQALPRLPSIAHHTQSPSKAPNQASKARKTRHLGQRIARQLRRLLGPLNRPPQNGAKAPLDSMVSRVVLAQARMHAYRQARSDYAHAPARA